MAKRLHTTKEIGLKGRVFKKQTKIDKIFNKIKPTDTPVKNVPKVPYTASFTIIPINDNDTNLDVTTPIIDSVSVKRSKLTGKLSITEKSGTIQFGSMNTIIDTKDVFMAIKSLTQKKTKDKPRGSSIRIVESDIGSLTRERSSFTFNKYLPLDDDTLSVNESASKFGTEQIRYQSFYENKNIFHKIKLLRYRENVFRAASRLAEEMPPYPDWTYTHEEMKYIDFSKINVGGRIFYIYEETLLNLLPTKLATCLKIHKSEGIPFFDRDPICFAAVIQFYRTGQLHTPPNLCLTLFAEELEFWGINELFLEPCCWSSYNNFQMSSTTIKKYSEDMKKSETFTDVSAEEVRKWRRKFYDVLIMRSGSVMSSWMSGFCTIFILLSIFSAVTSPSPIIRYDTTTGDYSPYRPGEFVSSYLMRTNVRQMTAIVDLMFTGFFLTELILRLILCPSKLEFFGETLNWVDLVATVTSLLSSQAFWPKSHGSLEGYLMILKIPRILRLFKLTTSLRSGMEAFVLTLRACAKELKLVFLILLISTTVFGCLLFVAEMVCEDENKHSKIQNVYVGMWLAIVTMTTVGYGDIHILSFIGYMIGAVCIICGVIICQLPVPIFLQNFRVYYNQATARFKHQAKLTVRYVDPEAINDAALSSKKPKKGKKTFTRLFNTIQ